MRTRLPLFGVVALAVAGIATSGCSSSPAANPYTTAQPSDAASGGGGNFGGGDGGDNDPSVKITIVTPADGDILLGAASADVRAMVSVTSTGSVPVLIDPQSISMTVTANGAGNAAAAAGLGRTPLVAAAAGDYRGKLSLKSLPSGDYVVRIDAGTTAGTHGFATVAIKVDSGPTITVLSPTRGGHYRGMMNIEVTVDSAPYGATALPLDATVGGVPVALQQVGTSSTFRGTIDFHQPIPPLVGDQLLIVAAKNGRGTRAELRTPFVVDESGPAITMTLPKPGDVVGGVITIQATIADDAGVLPSSVFVMIGNATDVKFKLPLGEQAPGVYSILFDTAKLTNCGPPIGGQCLVFPTLSFRAADDLGNETTVSYEITIDNQPPVIDLDPPMVRDLRFSPGPQCSWLFDPLSNNTLIGDMPGDGCGVSQVFDLRARVQDDGNFAGGLKKRPIAGLAPDTVAVFVLDDTGQPLVVDGDGDGICDSINPKLIPTTTPPTKNNEVLKVRLGPVPTAGKADFTPDPSLPGDTECPPGDDLAKPPIICTLNQPTKVINYAGGESAIWSLEPINKPFCEGIAFDTFANGIGEGWACIAVAAADKNGNASVSAPLRVWIDYAASGPFCPAPPPNAPPPPDCTGKFDKATGTLSNTPCTSRKYRSGEICYLGECNG